MTREQLEQEVLETLRGLDSTEAVDLLNTYWEQNRYDDRILPIEEFDNFVDGFSPRELLDLAYNEDYSRFSEWFMQDWRTIHFYDDVDVFDFLSEHDLLDTIVEDGDSLGNDELQELLDEFEEREEEEEEE